ANFARSAERADAVTASLLERLGIARTDAPRLRDVPPAALLEAQQQVLLGGGSDGRMALPFAPGVDGDLLAEPPRSAIRAGLSRDVPVLVGTTLEEWKLFSIMDGKARTLDEAALLRRCERNAPCPEPERAATARRAVAVYREARTARGERATPPEL